MIRFFGSKANIFFRSFYYIHPSIHTYVNIHINTYVKSPRTQEEYDRNSSNAADRSVSMHNTPGYNRCSWHIRRRLHRLRSFRVSFLIPNREKTVLAFDEKKLVKVDIWKAKRHRHATASWTFALKMKCSKGSKWSKSDDKTLSSSARQASCVFGSDMRNRSKN